MYSTKSSIAVVDLPNICNRILRLEIGEIAALKRYITDWLDFDIMLESFIANETLQGIMVFHSKNAIGPDKCKINNAEKEMFLKRLDKQKGLTTRDAGVPSTTVGEKGVDTILVTHLFKTIEFWDSAYIIAHDGDYAPAIAALREKGKFIYVLGFEEATHESLIKECYSFIDISNYIVNDFTNYNILGAPNSVIRQLKNLDPVIKAKSELYHNIDSKEGSKVSIIYGFDNPQSHIPEEIQQIIKKAELISMNLEGGGEAIVLTTHFNYYESKLIERHFPQGLIKYYEFLK